MNLLRYGNLCIRILSSQLCLVGLCLLFSGQLAAQQGSDIWLGKLNVSNKQPITDLVRITNTSRYTNQPYFFDNESLYYTQMEGEGDAAQIDVFLFNLSFGTSNNITQSTTSEYSPTPIPEKLAMSVIRVNDLGKQELWELNLQGNAKTHLLPHIEPVGYQVWTSPNTLLLFVLGEPHTLQAVVINEPEAAALTLDENIGASLFQYKKSPWFMYSQVSEEGHWLKSYHVGTKAMRQVAQLPDKVQYFAISPSGFVFASDGESVYRRQIIVESDKLQPHEKWEKVMISQKACVKGVSRIAVSPDESMIALVCAR